MEDGKCRIRKAGYWVLFLFYSLKKAEKKELSSEILGCFCAFFSIWIACEILRELSNRREKKACPLEKLSNLPAIGYTKIGEENTDRGMELLAHRQRLST